MMKHLKERIAALLALVSDTGGTPDRKIVSRRANTGRVLKDALWYIEDLERRTPPGHPPADDPRPS